MVLSRITNGGSPRLLVLGALKSICIVWFSGYRGTLAKPEWPPFLRTPSLVPGSSAADIS
jgi:hypothetical protein